VKVSLGRGGGRGATRSTPYLDDSLLGDDGKLWGILERELVEIKAQGVRNIKYGTFLPVRERATG